MTCSICRLELRLPHRLPCSHTFCLYCIKKHLFHKNFCPQCLLMPVHFVDLVDLNFECEKSFLFEKEYAEQKGLITFFATKSDSSSGKHQNSEIKNSESAKNIENRKTPVMKKIKKLDGKMQKYEPFKFPILTNKTSNEISQIAEKNATEGKITHFDSDYKNISELNTKVENIQEASSNGHIIKRTNSIQEAIIDNHTNVKKIKSLVINPSIATFDKNRSIHVPLKTTIQKSDGANDFMECNTNDTPESHQITRNSPDIETLIATKTKLLTPVCKKGINMQGESYASVKNENKKSSFRRIGEYFDEIKNAEANKDLIDVKVTTRDARNPENTEKHIQESKTFNNSSFIQTFVPVNVSKQQESYLNDAPELILHSDYSEDSYNHDVESKKGFLSNKITAVNSNIALNAKNGIVEIESDTNKPLLTHFSPPNPPIFRKLSEKHNKTGTSLISICDRRDISKDNINSLNNVKSRGQNAEKTDPIQTAKHVTMIKVHNAPKQITSLENVQMVSNESINTLKTTSRFLKKIESNKEDSKEAFTKPSSKFLDISEENREFFESLHRSIHKSSIEYSNSTKNESLPSKNDIMTTTSNSSNYPLGSTINPKKFTQNPISNSKNSQKFNFIATHASKDDSTDGSNSSLGQVSWSDELSDKNANFLTTGLKCDLTNAKHPNTNTGSFTNTKKEFVDNDLISELSSSFSLSDISSPKNSENDLNIHSKHNFNEQLDNVEVKVTRAQPGKIHQLIPIRTLNKPMKNNRDESIDIKFGNVTNISKSSNDIFLTEIPGICNSKNNQSDKTDTIINVTNQNPRNSSNYFSYRHTGITEKTQIVSNLSNNIPKLKNLPALIKVTNQGIKHLRPIYGIKEIEKQQHDSNKYPVSLSIPCDSLQPSKEIFQKDPTNLPKKIGISIYSSNADANHADKSVFYTKEDMFQKAIQQIIADKSFSSDYDSKLNSTSTKKSSDQCHQRLKSLLNETLRDLKKINFATTTTEKLKKLCKNLNIVAVNRQEMIQAIKDIILIVEVETKVQHPQSMGQIANLVNNQITVKRKTHNKPDLPEIMAAFKKLVKEKDIQKYIPKDYR